MEVYRQISAMEPSIARSKSFDSASSSQLTKCSLEQVLKQYEDLRRSQEDTETAFPRQSNTNLASWAGDNDEENPRNFRSITKISIGVNVSLMNLVISFAVSVVSSMLGQIAYDFKQHDLEETQLAVTVYITGLAFGNIEDPPSQHASSLMTSRSCFLRSSVRVLRAQKAPRTGHDWLPYVQLFRNSGE